MCYCNEDLLKEVIWRVTDIREMLVCEHSYRLDEWSTPVVNLATLERILRQYLPTTEEVM